VIKANAMETNLKIGYPSRVKEKNQLLSFIIHNGKCRLINRYNTLFFKLNRFRLGSLIANNSIEN